MMLLLFTLMGNRRAICGLCVLVSVTHDLHGDIIHFRI